MAGQARAFFRRHWQRLLRLRERLRISEEAFHLILAGLVGVIGGLVNLFFYACIDWAMAIGLSQSGDIVEAAQHLAGWQRLTIPVLGGLVAGLVLFWGLRLAGHQGAANLLEVVVAGDGRLRMRSALVKALSSVISVATGASIGREGPITHLTATFASKAGQLAKWPPYRLRLLVACGAASGMAAAYNAPVAGAVFAAQIVLGSFSMNLFAPLVFASVIATMVSRSFFGIDPWYEVPAFEFNRLIQLLWFVILGILAGLLGGVFLKMLRYIEERFDQLKRPIYERLALGGLLVGCLAYFYPEVWGNGYSVTNRLLHEDVLIWALLGIFLAKLLATSISVGAGVVGGVFTPTLFLGAGLGALFGRALHQMGFAQNLPEGAFGLVGMGCVLSATVHSPLLALIMIFEISLNYTLMPPLMIGCVIATLVARRIHPDSIYTEPLRRKGVEMGKESGPAGAGSQKLVAELMREPIAPLSETANFREMADRFLTSPNNFLPVVDAQGRLIGVVALQDMKEYLSMGAELISVIAYDVMRPPPPALLPNQTLDQAFPVLLASELRNVPVVNNPKEFRLVGSIIRSEALSLLTEAIEARTRT